jgi:hypothetical protein
MGVTRNGNNNAEDDAGEEHLTHLGPWWKIKTTSCLEE